MAATSPPHHALQRLPPPMRLDGGVLRFELLFVVDDHTTMNEVTRLALIMELECFQSLKDLQMNKWTSNIYGRVSYETIK